MGVKFSGSYSSMEEYEQEQAEKQANRQPVSDPDAYPSNYDPVVTGYNIKASPEYKRALQMFSDLPDKSWLTMLQQYSTLPAVSGETFIDWVTGAYDQRVVEAYNKQIANITNLINDYYKHVNSLPETQVQQASDAGVNLAVSGDINSSVLDTQPSTLSTLENKISDVPSFISSVVGAASSVVGAVTTVVKNVADVQNARRGLDIQEGSFLGTMWSTLSREGFDLGGQSFRSLDDLSSWIGANATDPEIKRRLNESMNKLITSDVNFAPYRSAFVDQNGDFNYDHNKLRSFLKQSMNVDSVAEVDAGLNLIADFQMQSMLLDKMSSYYTSVYREAMASGLDGSLAGTAANVTNSKTISEGILMELRADLQSQFISDFADQWNNSKSPEARYALLAELTNLNLDDQVMIELIGEIGSPSLAKGVNKLIDSTAEGVGDLYDTVTGLLRRKPKVSKVPKVPKRK